jgi:hemolysin activation/secretion protein
MFGGKLDAIRGYVGGQYRDDVSLTTQLEFRWSFYKKWGMVAFAGIGEVAPTVGDMNLDDLLPSAGVGLRFMASEKHRVNLGIDYARGKDSDAWYFRIGEAF